MHKLDEITYKGGIEGGKVVEGGTFTGFFKAEMKTDPKIEKTRGRMAGIPVDDPNIIGRNLASFAVAKLVGADVITPTYKAKHQQKGDEDEVAGIIMEKIEGVRGVDLGPQAADQSGRPRCLPGSRGAPRSVQPLPSRLDLRAGGPSPRKLHHPV